MSQLIEEQWHFLEVLRTCNKKQKRALLKTIDKKQLNALSEIAHNVIIGTIILTPIEKNRLKKYKKILTILGKKKATRRERLRALYRGSSAVVHLLEVVASRLWKK